MRNLATEQKVVPEVLVADQACQSHRCPCQSVPADQAALRAKWMPSLWVRAVLAPPGLLVELAAARAAVEQLEVHLEA